MAVFSYNLNKCASEAASEGYIVSLHTADPGTTGANEVSTSGTGYARKTVAAAGWEADGKRVQNKDPIDFGDPTGTWGTVSHYLLRRSGGSNEAAWSGAFQTPFIVTADVSSVTIAANTIAVVYDAA